MELQVIQNKIHSRCCLYGESAKSIPDLIKRIMGQV